MVAQDKLFIAVFDADSSSQVYSTELFTPSDLNIEHKKALWLLPGFEIGIQLIGETVEDLVKTRTYFNVMLILIMDIVLIFGVWFVYRSVRQEVKLAQLKSDFVSNVSHEIRTPLAVINMYAETLEMDRIKSEDKKKEYYKVIHTEANRLSAMVNKILNFSKIESGKRDYRFANIDINEVVGHVIQTYQHHFDHHGFECNFEKGNDLPQVNADKEAITEAIINLVDNAMKYSAGKKRIEIRAFLQKGMVGIEIKDYGIGIDDKEKKLIFDKFYRVTKGDLAHKAKGSGIGLNIVKHIMDAHQGSVSLKSTPGHGSIFTLYLPVK
jgi:two-component system phosphate regulon sensor histidine kinase PhoR